MISLVLPRQFRPVRHRLTFIVLFRGHQLTVHATRLRHLLRQGRYPIRVLSINRFRP